MSNVTHLSKKLPAIGKTGKNFTLLIGEKKNALIVGKDAAALAEAEKECGKVKTKVRGKCKLVNNELVLITKKKPNSKWAKAVKMLAKEAKFTKVSRFEQAAEKPDAAKPATGKAANAAGNKADESPPSSDASAAQPASAWTAGKAKGQKQAKVTPSGDARGVTIYRERVKSMAPLLQVVEAFRSSPDDKVQRGVKAADKLRNEVQGHVDERNFVAAMPLLDKLEDVLNVVASAGFGQPLDAEAPSPAPQGKVMATKKLEAQYAGEEKQYGWRFTPAPKMPVLTDDMSDQKKAALKATFAKWQAWYDALPPERKAPADSDAIVTKHYTPEEQQKSAAPIKKGKVQDASGKTIQGSRDSIGRPVADTSGYVLNPETGNMHLFTPTEDKVINPQTGNEQSRQVFHSSVLAGQDVAGAGELAISEGKVVSVDNKSGHYRPNTAMLLQTVEHLVSQGAMVSEKLVDAAGNSLSKRDKKLFATVVERMETLAAAIRQKRTQAPPEEVEHEEKLLSQHLAALRKLGWGADNRVIGTVENVAEMGNLRHGGAVHAAQGAVAGTLDFLSSGGNAKTKSGERVLDVKRQIQNTLAALNQPEIATSVLEGYLTEVRELMASGNLDEPATALAKTTLKNITDRIKINKKFAGTIQGNLAADQEAEARAGKFQPDNTPTERELVAEAKRAAKADMKAPPKPGRQPDRDASAGDDPLRSGDATGGANYTDNVAFEGADEELSTAGATAANPSREDANDNPLRSEGAANAANYTGTVLLDEPDAEPPTTAANATHSASDTSHENPLRSAGDGDVNYVGNMAPEGEDT